MEEENPHACLFPASVLVETSGDSILHHADGFESIFRLGDLTRRKKEIVFQNCFQLYILICISIRHHLMSNSFVYFLSLIHI